MTALHVYVLDCDAPGCTARFDPGLAQAGDARARARLCGWTCVTRPTPLRSGPAPSIGLCPEHKDFSLDEAVAGWWDRKRGSR